MGLNNELENLNLITDIFAAEADATNKVQALDKLLTAVTLDLTELNAVDVALGGLGGFASIALALTDIAGLLTAGAGGGFVIPQVYTPVQQAGSVNIAASTINQAILLKISTRVLVAGSYAVTGAAPGAGSLRLNTFASFPGVFTTPLQAAGAFFASNTAESTTIGVVSVAGSGNWDFQNTFTAGGISVNHFYFIMYQLP